MQKSKHTGTPLGYAVLYYDLLCFVASYVLVDLITFGENAFLLAPFVLLCTIEDAQQSLGA